MHNLEQGFIFLEIELISGNVMLDNKIKYS